MGSEDRPKESTAMSNKSISWCLRLVWDIAIGYEIDEAFINDPDKKLFQACWKREFPCSNQNHHRFIFKPGLWFQRASQKVTH